MNYEDPGNVFIGNGAGYSVGSSNQLYISNSSTSHLIIFLPLLPKTDE